MDKRQSTPGPRDFHFEPHRQNAFCGVCSGKRAHPSHKHPGGNLFIMQIKQIISVTALLFSALSAQAAPVTVDGDFVLGTASGAWDGDGGVKSEVQRFWQ